jgi:hypothetical protein
MKTTHRYILEPYKGMNTRFTCPSCGEDKMFSHYIDKETGEQLDPSVGRCNRESNCGYHLTPKQYFKENKIALNTATINLPIQVPSKPKQTSFIPHDIFELSQCKYNSNYFVQYLSNHFGGEESIKLIRKYFIGTSIHCKGAAIFWQIDIQGRIRTGKIMLYDATTGRRVKNSAIPVNWVHKYIKQPDFALNQCLFGEHLLIDNSKPVAVVESEKTAIIASAYFPDYIWIATGGKQNLNAKLTKILNERTVVLWPDINAYSDWKGKAIVIPYLKNTQIFDFIEKNATEAERSAGLDIADFLLKYKLSDFRNSSAKSNDNDELKNIQNFEIRVQNTPIGNTTKTEFKSWSEEILTLESFFDNCQELPDTLVLYGSQKISKPKIFIQSHLSIVKENEGNPTFLPYLERLKMLKRILQKSK